MKNDKIKVKSSEQRSFTYKSMIFLALINFKKTNRQAKQIAKY